MQTADWWLPEGLGWGEGKETEVGSWVEARPR